MGVGFIFKNQKALFLEILLQIFYTSELKKKTMALVKKGKNHYLHQEKRHVEKFMNIFKTKTSFHR